MRIFITAVFFLLLLSCGKDAGFQEETSLETTFIVLNHQKQDFDVKVNGNRSWFFDGLITSELDKQDTIPFPVLRDSVIGDWYAIIKRENGRVIHIQLDENEEIKRSFTVSIFNGSSRKSLRVEQEGLN